LAPVYGLWVGRRGRRHARPCDSAASRVVAVKQGEVDCHTLWHGRIGKPCGDPVPGRVVGDLRARLRPVVLPVGLRHGGQECRPVPRQRQAAPAEITGRPPRLGRDLGLREHPTAPQHGDVVGIELVVCGAAPMAGLHRAGRPKHTGKAWASAEVGTPRPGQEAFDADDQVGPVRRDGLETRRWAGWHVAVQHDLPVLVEEADLQGAGLQGDATGNFGLLRVTAPAVSSASVGCEPSASSPTVVCRAGGLNQYPPRAADALQRPLLRRSRFRQPLTPGVIAPRTLGVSGRVNVPVGYG